jgi:hypothetical protein
MEPAGVELPPRAGLTEFGGSRRSSNHTARRTPSTNAIAIHHGHHGLGSPGSNGGVLHMQPWHAARIIVASFTADF